MKKYNEVYNLFKDQDFTKKSTIKTFKKFFNCDFDIELIENKIIVHTDLPLFFEVEYYNDNNKKHIYAFLRYIANVFDFSYSLEFSSIEDLEF